MTFSLSVSRAAWFLLLAAALGFGRSALAGPPEPPAPEKLQANTLGRIREYLARYAREADLPHLSPAERELGLQRLREAQVAMTLHAQGRLSLPYAFSATLTHGFTPNFRWFFVQYLRAGETIPPLEFYDDQGRKVGETPELPLEYAAKAESRGRNNDLDTYLRTAMIWVYGPGEPPHKAQPDGASTVTLSVAPERLAGLVTRGSDGRVRYTPVQFAPFRSDPEGRRDAGAEEGLAASGPATQPAGGEWAGTRPATQWRTLPATRPATLPATRPLVRPATF